MDEEKKKRTRTQYADRVTLKPEVLALVNGWLEQLDSEFKGIRMSRAELVNWILVNHPPALSGTELQSLKEAFFDDVRYATWILEALKEARAKGEPASIEMLMNATANSRLAIRSRPKRTGGGKRRRSARDVNESVTVTAGSGGPTSDRGADDPTSERPE